MTVCHLHTQHCEIKAKLTTRGSPEHLFSAGASHAVIMRLRSRPLSSPGARRGRHSGFFVASGRPRSGWARDNAGRLRNATRRPARRRRLTHSRCESRAPDWEVQSEHICRSADCRTHRLSLRRRKSLTALGVISSRFIAVLRYNMEWQGKSSLLLGKAIAGWDTESGCLLPGLVEPFVPMFSSGVERWENNDWHLFVLFCLTMRWR